MALVRWSATNRENRGRSIRVRVTLHDVKSRIEEFSELAKRQFIHLGLTSRDLTENVEQLQVARSLQLVQFKVAAALLALARRAAQHRDVMITGRTHNVPAQPTTTSRLSNVDVIKPLTTAIAIGEQKLGSAP